MRLLAAQASTLDKRMVDPSASGSSSKAHTTSVKKALSSFSTLTECEQDMRARFEHDMALSMQLTTSVREEAAKLQHVKIVHAELSHPDTASDAHVSDSDPVQASKGQRCGSRLADGQVAPSPGPQQTMAEASPQMPSPSVTRSMHAQSKNAAQLSPQASPLTSTRLTRSMQAQMPEAAQSQHVQNAATPHAGSAGAGRGEGTNLPSSVRQARSGRKTGATPQAEPSASKQTALPAPADADLGPMPKASARPSPARMTRFTHAQTAATAAPSPEAAEEQSPQQSSRSIHAEAAGAETQSPGVRITRSMQVQMADAPGLVSNVCWPTAHDPAERSGKSFTIRKPHRAEDNDAVPWSPVAWHCSLCGCAVF